MKNLKIKNENLERIIESKFGEIVIDETKIVFFPYGLIGMPHFKNFALAECPNEKFKEFLVLQSLDQDGLCFLVTPLNLINSKYHSQKDLDEAMEAVGVESKDAAAIMIISTKASENEKRVLVVNTRAPIFIDTKNQTAMQYVLPNTDYSIQQAI